MFALIRLYVGIDTNVFVNNSLIIMSLLSLNLLLSLVECHADLYAAPDTLTLLNMFEASQVFCTETLH